MQYIVPSLRLLVPSSLLACHCSFLSKRCAYDIFDQSHFPSRGLVFLRSLLSSHSSSGCFSGSIILAVRPHVTIQCSSVHIAIASLIVPSWHVSGWVFCVLFALLPVCLLLVSHLAYLYILKMEAVYYSQPSKLHIVTAQEITLLNISVYFFTILFPLQDILSLVFI